MTPVPQQFCPTPRELDDLELLVNGALAPLTSFNEPGSAVTLNLPKDLGDAKGEIELVDPEGLPLALISPVPTNAMTGWPVTPLSHPQFGPFRRLYLSPEQVRTAHAGATFVPVTGPLTHTQLAQLAQVENVVLLALAGTGTPKDLSATGLIRATLASATQLVNAEVVAVALAARDQTSGGDAALNHQLRAQVVANYAGSDPVLVLSDTEDDSESGYLDEVAVILSVERPQPHQQGLVVFFTGLSGSGKSTLARALIDRLLEVGQRSVTSLDGDVVRRHLSAGLTFSRADRETNIRRIGWVAAEIARHGGVAICSPIAPFSETRAEVRQLVDAAGGAFFLVHVSTPLEECERRDRKGLYARARRGEIPEFTGISSPYEEPQDAAIRVDTSGRTITDALDDVLATLSDAGYFDLAATSPNSG
jgi:sulfate adenylyltransferase